MLSFVQGPLRMWSSFRRVLPFVCAAAWVVIVVAGTGWLWVYGSTPGRDGNPQHRWPSTSHVQPIAGKANLVMAVHPRCPCTRATLAELARLMAAAEGTLEAHLLFLAPATRPEGWERTDLWNTATAIPGVHAVVDRDGAEAARFGIETSGHVVLFDLKGNLGFSGGITAARGHEGDNAGRDAARIVASGQGTHTATHPVYGCPIFESPRVCTQEELR